MMLQDRDESAQKFALLKPNAPQFKLKIKSSSYLKARQPLRQWEDEPEVVSPNEIFNSTKPTEETFNFLENGGTMINKNHNYASKSMGRETVKGHNKVKILEPQYETSFNSKVQNRKHMLRNIR